MHVVTLPKIFRPFDCSNILRLGKNNDGGYLVSLDDVRTTKHLISLGIGTDISFEKDFTKLNDCAVSAYDKEINVDRSFFVNKKNYYNTFIDGCMLQKIIDSNDNIFLKCDIEGSEYNLLETIIKNSGKFTGMVFEFHSITNYNNFEQLAEFISKIDQKIVHVHVNNYFYYKTNNGNIPDILELTFTSSKNIVYNKNINLPHMLDMVNNPNDTEFKICFSPL